MPAASLVVKISADLNDFSRNLTKMTRDVDRAAKTIADVGKQMSLAITLPVGLVAAALAKMGLENDAVAARMRGSFGPAVDQVNGYLEQLGKVVPVAGTELQKMAIDVNNFAAGVGLAGPKAAALTESLLTMAADLSAKTGVGMAEATEALTRGLEGSTKQLKTMGVVINEVQIKQEAYRLGLMRVGQELTPLGTALSTYSLLQKQSAQFAGAAASVHQTAAHQFAMFTTAATELADRLSNLLLPALTAIAQFGSKLIDVFQSIPDWVYKAVFAFAAFLAGIGPAIAAVANLIEMVNKLRVAFELLTAAEMLAKIQNLFALMTDPKIVIAMVALSAVIGGVMLAWDKLTKKVEEAPKLAPPVDVKSLMGGNQPTAIFTGSESQQFQKQINEQIASFDRAVTVGDYYQGALDKIAESAKQAARELNTLGKSGQAFSEEANAYAAAYDRLAGVLSNARIVQAFGSGSGAQISSVVSRQAAAQKSDASIQFDLANSLRNTENQLRTREAAIQLPDTFNAVRVAALQMAEAQRAAAEQQALDYEKVRLGLDGFGIHLGSLSSGMQGVVVNLANVVTTFAQSLASRLSGKGPNAGFFGSLGGLVGGAFKVGSFFNPLLGAAGTIAGSLIGGLFDHTKQSTDDASSALDALATTANKVNEALSNLPTGFKIARDRYLATTPGSGPNSPGDTGGPSGPNPGGGGVPNPNATINIGGDLHVNGINVSNGATLIRAIADAAQANMNRGGNAFLIAGARA